MRNDGLPDMYPTWSKMRALLERLKMGDCRFVLLMDADAVITHLELPFEWLLNRWQVTPNTAMTMPKDPLNNEPNYDSKGRLNVNSGFVLTQNLPVSEEIVKETMNCPNNPTKYPGCERFKWRDLCEQGVLSEYIRYQYPNVMLEIDCNDANGYPNSGRPCEGVFARHHWDRKFWAKNALAESLVTNILSRVKQNFLDTPGIAIEG
jgi:hypothetical protein